jgi:hypothetical protein
MLSEAKHLRLFFVLSASAVTRPLRILLGAVMLSAAKHPRLFLGIHPVQCTTIIGGLAVVPIAT